MTSTPTSTAPAPAAPARLPLVLGLCGLVSLIAAAVLLMTGGPAASETRQTPTESAVGDKGSIDVGDAPYAGNPRNDPKVSCTVTVRFFDFLEGTSVTRVVFERPGAATPILTGDGLVLGAPAAGSDGLNAEKQYVLDVAVTQDDAGKSIPVKATAFVTHEGKDGWKSKVFKCVAPDEPTEPTTEPTEPTTEPTEPTTEPTEPTTEPTEPTTAATTVPTDAGTSEVGGVATAQPSDGGGKNGGEVAGAEEEAVPTVIDAGATGWTTRDLWGSGLAGAGIALLVAALAMSVTVGRRAA
ncbi:hypothetical protein [Nocardioides daeguensis]|uniref:Uncharacterized protein n=1 Tax=Nocardioides daeguensis TaxID=908359 RepID=A0ABP6UR04_9ACTN|nr:hypothetical protein [Nocardioides daeguensis]MBV6728367.1 hypothetical protein [Nocardioides daeguensis]MCR1773176.1 hypothetical protein [Nocardioides daeguensis]